MNRRRIGLGLLAALGTLIVGFGWVNYWAGMRASIMSRWYRTSNMNFWHVSFLLYGPKPKRARPQVTP